MVTVRRNVCRRDCPERIVMRGAAIKARGKGRGGAGEAGMRGDRRRSLAHTAYQ